MRIEDTDNKRFVDGAEDYITNAMDWLGLTFDEGPSIGGSHGPYRQSERNHLYKDHINYLLDNNFAYIAFDTSEDIDALKDEMKASGVKNPRYDYITRSRMKNSLTMSSDDVKARLDAGDDYVVRIKMPRTGDVTFNDLVRGNVRVAYNTIDDKVLVKSNGIPTYHLANVIDDHLMDISHVLRGDEWLPSMPLHIYLYDCFGWTPPKFAHLPLILNPDGKGKLSKRSGKKFDLPVYPIGFVDPEDGVKCLGFKDNGFFPAATLNYLALLGWNPKNDVEFFTLDDLCKIFKLDHVNKAPIRFDMDKAKAINKNHLNAMDNYDLADKLLVGNPTFDRDRVADAIGLVKSRATFLKDVWTVGKYFFFDPTDFDALLVDKFWKGTSVLHLSTVGMDLDAMTDDWTEDNIIASITKSMGNYDLPYTKAMGAVRLALTNFKFGPTVLEIMMYLGKETCVKRMRHAVATLG